MNEDERGRARCRDCFCNYRNILARYGIFSVKKTIMKPELMSISSHLVDYYLHGFTSAGGVLFANNVSWVNEE